MSLLIVLAKTRNVSDYVGKCVRCTSKNLQLLGGFGLGKEARGRSLSVASMNRHIVNVIDGGQGRADDPCS